MVHTMWLPGLPGPGSFRHLCSLKPNPKVGIDLTPAAQRCSQRQEWRRLTLIAPDSLSGSANPCRLVGQEEPFETPLAPPGDEDHGETSSSLQPLDNHSGPETQVQPMEKPHTREGRDALMEATAHGDLTQE